MCGQGKHLQPHLQNHGLLQEENLDPQDILLSKSTPQSYFRKSQALSADLLQKSILSYHLCMHSYLGCIFSDFSHLILKT